MKTKLYGSLNNRMEEGRMFCDKIEVGTGVTEYKWSDRSAYEVVSVKDQKHVSIRKYDHVHVGQAYENKWELVSNESNPVIDIERRGDVWYRVVTVTREDLEEINGGAVTLPTDNYDLIIFAINGFDLAKILEKGKQTKRYKMSLSFGVADYYYDFEF